MQQEDLAVMPTNAPSRQHRQHCTWRRWSTESMAAVCRMKGCILGDGREVGEGNKDNAASMSNNGMIQGPGAGGNCTA